MELEFKKTLESLEPITELKIDRKTYELKFGIGFVRELDKLFPVTIPHVVSPYGGGLLLMLNNLKQGSPTALCDVILAATSTLTNKPDSRMVEDYLETSEESIEDLCALFIEALLTSKVTQQQALSQLRSLGPGAEQSMLELLDLKTLNRLKQEKTAKKSTKS